MMHCTLIQSTKQKKGLFHVLRFLFYLATIRMVKGIIFTFFYVLFGIMGSAIGLYHEVQPYLAFLHVVYWGIKNGKWPVVFLAIHVLLDIIAMEPIVGLADGMVASTKATVRLQRWVPHL